MRNFHLSALQSLRRLTCVAFGCLFSAFAFAGPPYLTDDPEPVELGHVEINVAFTQTLSKEARSGALPLAEINYGAMRDVQLHAALPINFTAPQSGPRQSGIGDAEFGAKYRLIQESESAPMVAVYPTVLLPSGNRDRGLGNGGAQFLLPVWAQKSWGPWTVDMGVGYWINRAPGSKNNLYGGVLLQRALSERLSVGAQLFHRTEQAPGAGGDVRIQCGLDCDAVRPKSHPREYRPGPEECTGCQSVLFLPWVSVHLLTRIGVRTKRGWVGGDFRSVHGRRGDGDVLCESTAAPDRHGGMRQLPPLAATRDG